MPDTGLGEFRFVRKGVETNREWYVAVGSERSVTIDQRVKAVVTLTTPGSLRGQVIPNHADDRVWVEEQTSGHWTVIARPRLSRGSTYHSTGCQGRPVRVVFPGDGRNVRSASAERMSTCSGY